MLKKIDLKKILPHLLVIAGFILILFIYFKPVFENKQLRQHDIVMAKAMQEEIKTHYEKTGHFPLWTNAVFGGMPVYQIWSIYPKNIATYFVQLVKLWLGEPIGYVFVYFICFYILMLILGMSPYLAGIGAFAFAFGSYNFINIETGHLTKALAVGIAPLVIAGVILALRGKLLGGMVLTAIALSMEIRVNHLQITYYLFIMLLVLFIVEFINVVKEKRYVSFLKSIGVLAVALVLAVGVNITALWTTNEYMKYSMRGGSELSSKTAEAKGLEKDYALSWSYGVKESFTLLIPYFYGGASVENLGKNSKLAEAGVPKSNLKAIPTYWGTLQSTSGPIYIGAVIIFLFLFGMLIIKHRYKWWLFATTVLALMLSWGSNFMFLTTIFFDYFPLYNKFRVPMTLLLVVGMSTPILSMMAIKEFLDGKIKQEEIFKSLKISFFTLGGITLFLALFGGGLFDFVGQVDEILKQNKWSDDIIETLRQDRARMLRTDAFRSFMFILIAAAAIYLYMKKMIKLRLFLGIMALSVLIDMWGVDKRYFNKDDFYRKSRNKVVYVTPTEADNLVMQDTDPHFRVLDLANNTWNDASKAFFFKMIGGYHGAKMARYQDMIENHFTPEIRKLIYGLQNTGQVNFAATPTLNMMNTKYYIAGENAAMVFPNPGRYGNAWFVEQVFWVNNPDEEIDTLDHFDLRKVAVVDKRFKNELKTEQLGHDSFAAISLTSYAPDQMTYQCRSAAPQLALFSEVFYDKGWNAYIDGKPEPHFRANYILRAMVVPAGEHEIVFKFEPKSHATGEVISTIFSILIAISVILVLYYYWKQIKPRKEVPAK